VSEAYPIVRVSFFCGFMPMMEEEMEKVNIQLKDGSIKEVDKGSTIFEIAKSIHPGLAKEAIAAEVNGKVVGMLHGVDTDIELSIMKFDDERAQSVFRHTSSHILAQAVKKLYPGAKLGIGPAIENGFYYDFDVEEPFTEESLKKIEKEMDKIIQNNLELERFELPRNEALQFMAERNEPYKVELINDLPEDAVISFYKQGDFVDLCAGPHLSSTKAVKAFKLTSVAGAYWRGSEKNKMLQRIYGTSFPKKKDLDDYLQMLEEAKKRDHRKLGKELDLFLLLDEGKGFPFFLPKGVELKNTLINYWREVRRKRGYVEIETPIILSRSLWETSGHWYHYKDNMYTTKIDDEDHAIKPMNCPGALLVYQNAMHSYKEFPLRYSELGRVHRHELSGALHGLMRVRAFTQDDAHIFLLPDQIKDEIKSVTGIVDEIYKALGFNYKIELSTKPEESMGSDEEWSMAENMLQEALNEMGIDYKINEGDGAFYGPKIDFKLEDCLGRTWQCATIQLDFQLPQRFEIAYIGPDGEKHTPIMIHTVALGSLERFVGILIEHFAGKFPLWISPSQVKVLPISDKFHDYAEEITHILKNLGFKVELDNRNEKIGYKIREAQLEKHNYMIIIGEKEVESRTLSVRSRDEGDLGSQNIEDFIAKLQKEIHDKEIKPIK